MMYWKSIEEKHTVLLELEAQRNLDLSLKAHVTWLRPPARCCPRLSRMKRKMLTLRKYMNVNYSVNIHLSLACILYIIGNKNQGFLATHNRE